MALPRSSAGCGTVVGNTAAAPCAAALYPSRRRFAHRRGFTLVELLTVVAVIAILASLILSAVAGARKRSRQTFCGNNLRQVALAVELYQDEAGRRPRSFTKLSTKPAILPNPRSLLCPADPSLLWRKKPVAQTNLVAWGNVANTSQEPESAIHSKDDLESPTWEIEMAEIRETVGFSYLHPLFWRKSAWKTLLGLGNQAGVGICQVHGVSLPNLDRLSLQTPAYMAWEGVCFRAQRDGAVVPRKIFRGFGAKPGAGNSGSPIITPVIHGDYPWEFYSDTLPTSQRKI